MPRRLAAWTWRGLAPGSAFWPWLVITAFGLWALWPVPTGVMPLSADHTVHLSRIHFTGQELAQGRLRGWNSSWFFGTPIGEFYPVLGDWVVLALRTLSLGLLRLDQAYALGFTLIFLSQGWVMLRVGKALGMGHLPGLIAGILILADPGFTREGGWMYTVYFGVWPQALATSLCWWGFAELALASRSVTLGAIRKHVVLAALALGLSLLAHPMSMLTVAMGAPIIVICFWVGGRYALPPGRGLYLGVIAVFSGVALAAVWLAPMFAGRGYMASYGWLADTLPAMGARAQKGELARNMPALWGFAAGGGVVLALMWRESFARFLVLFTTVTWLFAASTTFWNLRLDYLSEGFLHIQYQRFLIAAKPGIFLLAGVPVGVAYTAADRIWSRKWLVKVGRTPRRILAGLLLVGAAAGLGVAADSVKTVLDKQDKRYPQLEVGNVQTARATDDESFAADYADFLAWLDSDRSSTGLPGERIAIKDVRNTHWFMDAPAYVDRRIYKAGFTPGDNFVHKPESAKTEVLDALGATFLVRRTQSQRGSARIEATFGDIRVDGRDTALPPVTVRGAGEVEILEFSPDTRDGGEVRVRLDGSDADSRLVFHIAGHPRWRLEKDGTVLDWFEVPVYTPRGQTPAIATPAQRLAGEVRGGRANGDDGTEPTLIASEGAGDGEYVLRYRPRRARDVLAGLISLGTLLCLFALVRGRFGAGLRQAFDAALRRSGTKLGTWIFVAVVVSFGGLVIGKWLSGRAEQSSWASAMLDPGTPLRSARRGPVKADMLIRPAIIVAPTRSEPASVTLPDVVLPERIQGWAAVDDDAAKVRDRYVGRHYDFRVEVDAGGGWQVLGETRVKHRPDSEPIDIETGALAGQSATLRVVVESPATRPPLVGFNLWLDPDEAMP